MRTRILLSAVLVAALSGCVIHEHDTTPPPSIPGNVDVVWTFGDGNTCQSLFGFVSTIQVSIGGETLANGGAFDCETAGTQGIQLQDFAPGTYTFTVDALSSSGFVLYSASGNFTVDGDITVAVTLNPVGNQEPGNITLFWNFADGSTCLNAGVDHVVVNIPGQTLQNAGIFPCTVSGTQGIQLGNPPFSPGSYNITVTAMDVADNPLYQGTDTVVVNGDVQDTVQLTPVQSSSATLQIRWAFQDALQNLQSCASVGVSHVQITFGNGAPTVVACDVNGVDGADFINFSSGQYSVDMQALDANGTALYSYDAVVAVSAPLTQLTADFGPIFGSWDLAYDFANAGSCSAAGVTQVSLSVKDAQGNEISGIQPGTRYPCGDAPSNNVFHWDNFPGGDVNIEMHGYSSSGLENWGALRTTTITAGASNSNTVTLDTCGTTGAGC